MPKNRWLKENTSKKNNGKSNGKSHIPFRLNFLFFIIFAAFVALIVQLAYLQIVNGEMFQTRIDASSKKTVVQATPRGMIYDVNGQVLVGNQAVPAITYTKGSGTTASQMRAVAEKLITLIAVPEDKGITPRDLKDYFLAETKNYDTVHDRIADKDLKDEHGDNLSEGQIYQKVVDNVTDEEITFDATQVAAATLFKRMNAAYSLTTIFLKNEGVTDQEIAVIGERAQEIPGVAAGTDWQREYPFGSTLRSVLGTVSTEKTGLPAELADKYLALGYAMNDRVGTSFLEAQYEQALQGTKAQNQVEVNANGEIINQVQTFAGQKGENLVSTIDITFQQKVEEILNRYYTDMIAQKKTTYSDGIYAVAMDPNTGDVLAMAGLDHNLVTDELTNNPLSTINNVFVPGSVIKGATVASGYQNGVLAENQVFIDQPLQFSGTPIKASIYNKTIGTQIPMDTVRALGQSSNVYMMNIALSLMGVSYTPNMGLPNDLSVFDKLRSTYAQFGLGSATGLDVPNYSNGLVTPTQNFLEGDGTTITPGSMGLALDLSFGNYDNYTTMQLAQYASTIATSGKRYAPRLVKGIYANDEAGQLGAVSENFQPQLLNTVSLEASQWQIIHDGFYATTHESYGTARSILAGAQYDVAAKTGTAETYYFPGDGTQHAAINSSLVAYAPADNPKITIAVMLPHLTDSSGGFSQNVGKEILDAYYDLYEK
ncbi:peptidoglycan D,D-transpeptidase FtsI family protein [Enterococcus timonensis]|uniref:peptidoglycan D,D-transpeptidase FtsI family protein n=1 Tax=Enterococcus timonensis TaxID=1852364 RepID=UPI0008D9CAAD|nr:penicillin-binding protein 2 [Enterococcus timonensis]